METETKSTKVSKRPCAKHWCFTINNWTDDEIVPTNDEIDYMIIGKEVGENLTPHLQGYVAFKKKMTLNEVKKKIPRGHLEVMRGTPKEASDYCKKEGNFHEEGTLATTGGQATKKNWDAAKAMAIAGDIEEIESAIYIPHYNTLRRIATDHQPKVSSIAKLSNEWHYGPTGTGKSRLVREKYPDAFIKDANKWWDGYRGEDVVIIEDIDKYDISLGRQVKLWGDHYAFPADMKCQGKRDIRPKKIIFTSNWHPEEIWDDTRTSDPICRRYALIKHE